MKRPFWTCCIVGLSLVVFGCGTEDGNHDGGPGTGGGGACGEDSSSVAGTTGEFPPEPAPGSDCGAIVTQETLPPGWVTHAPACSPLTFSSNPPSSGTHYPSWADFQVFDRPVARGYWVHSLEHRAVVIVYNCTDCDDEVEAAKAFIETLPEDPLCIPHGRQRRVILTPDPLLDVRWGAAAWGFTLKSDCFEPSVFEEFALQHSAEGPENFCNPP